MTDRGIDERRTANWETARFPPPALSPRSRGASPDAGPPAPADHYPADFVCIVGGDGRILRADAADTTPTEEGAAPGSVFDLTAIEHHEAARIALKGTFTTGMSHGYECRGRTPHLDDQWYECRLTPHKHEGTVVSATVVIRDIGRWLRMEDKLRRERDYIATTLKTLQDREAARTDNLDLERFRAILDQAGEAIFLTDPASGLLLDVNETACRWLGATREELCARRASDLELEFPLDNSDGVSDHVTDTRDAHRPRIYDGMHRRRNGTSFPVEVAVARRQFSGRDILLAVARDIKGRRRLEDAVRESEVIYRSLFELSHDAVYLSARDGSVADVNDAAIDLFGYTRDEFLSMPASDLYARPEDIRAFQRAVDEHEVVRDLHVEFVAKNGAIIPGRLTATLRHAGDGSVLGYQCMIQRVAPPTPPQPSAPIAHLRNALRHPARDSVLVVEADGDVVREVVAVLELAGIPVYGERDAAAAIEAKRAHMDEVGTVLLGVTDGWGGTTDLLAELRGLDPTLRFVLLGNDVTQADVEQRAHQGVCGFVRKPIYPLALVEHLRRAMRQTD